MIDWPMLAGGGALCTLVGTAAAVPRLWRPVRRWVAAVDVLAGRPERYPGDPEARPGLVERLDRLDGRLDRMDQRLARLEDR